MPVGANAGIGALSVNVGVNLTQFDAGMRQVEQRGAEVAKSLNGIGSALTTGAGIGAGFAVATAALSGLSSVAQAAGSAVIGLNSQLEQARIGFTAFTGSAEKANNFVKQLQQFAASTTFEFPGLLQSARQLTGMGVQAELVIPILKDVGTAVMAVGGGNEQIKRVNLALTQMMAAGKVNAQDMNQLAQAGIPAWKMLADSMGLTIGQVRELSKQGQVTAAQLLEAFHKFAQGNGMSDMLQKASQTWEAATSNIIDGLRNIGAEGFEPLFNVMRDFAVRLATILTSPEAANFAQDLKATVQDIINTAKPLGDVFNNAFAAFKTDGVSGALQSIWTDVQKLVGQMGGAGMQLISEFAGGIVQGASTLITEAANFVADTIASFLIGNSPPPVGPLSQIAKGGENVIAAYVEGLRTGLTGIDGIAQQVSDALGNVGKSLTLSGAAAELKAAGDNMLALRSAAEDVDGALRTIDDRIKDNQASTKDYQNAVTDIKDAYEGAIDPLQKQLDALKEANDLATKQADIQDRITLANLKGALQKAQGDPVQRARLQTQLDTLGEQEKELSLQERSLSLQQQSANLVSRQHVDELRAAALRAKNAGDEDKAKKLTQEAQQASLKDTENSQAANGLAQRRLQLQMQQAQIQQQLNGMVDKEAVARIKGQQAQVTAVKDQRDINQEVANLNRELAAAPIEQQIKDLKSQEQALLQPIQERITANQREAQGLQEQRQAWQGLKADIMDVMQQQRELAADAKKNAADAKKASAEAALANPLDLSAIFKPEAITAQATKVGESFLKGFNGYLSEHGPQLIGGAIGGMLGAAAFGPLGAIAGAAFGSQFVTRMQQNFGNLENLGGLVAGKISDALNIDTGGSANSAEAFAKIWETVKDRIHLAIEQLIIDIARFTGIDVSSGATQVDRLGLLWEGLKDRVTTAITDIIAKVSELTGIDTSGAQSNIEAIGTIWEGVKAKTTTAIADIQQTFQPFVDDIKGQWQSAVDAVNSAEFQDNISTIAKNVSLVMQALKGDIDNTKVSLDTLNDTKLDGTGWISVGQALQSVVHDVAVLTTAFVNLMDLFNTTDRITQLFVQNLGSALRGVADIAKATKAFVAGDFDAAEAIFGDKLQMDQDIKARGADIQQMWADMLARIKQRAADTNAAGKNVVDGVVQGIQAEQPALDSAVQGVATGAVSKWAETMQSRSPSQVMAEQGTFLNQGVALGLTESAQLVLDAVTTETTTMLSLYADGFSAIHEQTGAQLDEIYALVQEKTTDTAGLVPIQMQIMLQAYGTGLSAIHAQSTQQLDEIYALFMQKGTDITGTVKIMMDNSLQVVTSDQERWRAAGLALGNALAEGLASAQLQMQRSGMQLMGNVTGGSKASPQLQGTINDAAQRHHLDPRMFTAQLQLESAGFDPNVLTGARRGGQGEVGIGQFLPDTLKGLGVDIDTYLKDVNLQVETSAKYLESLVQQYGSIDKALQAYNGGPGGVGTAATQRYTALVHQIADTLQQASGGGNGATLMSNGVGGRMQLNVDQITAGRQAGLTQAEAAAICGPYAALLFAQFTGKNPSLAEAKELASAVGWTAGAGMGGTGNFMALLGRMGINAVRQTATPENVNAALAAGNPIALSTPKHYFVGAGGTAESGINVGATGTVMGGAPSMTLDQITKLGGGMNDLIVLTSKLDAAGTKTFQDLTHVSGQFGTGVAEDTSSVNQDIQTTATTGASANQALSTSAQTLAQSIQSGIVPAGLAARDSVGQMAIGIQPLISTWAAGQMTSNQLAESIVQLASQTGLATAPLEAFKAGNVSVGEALRTVLTSLAQTDPAFAEIQQSMGGAQLSTEQLADVLLSGLANVTGSVSASLGQIATGALPVQQAFDTGATSGDAFVQSVVALAAQSGLTQAPLRMMQDGVLTANQALAMVISTTAKANPGLADINTAFADMPQPATDAAKAFLAWVQSMQQTQQATDAAAQTVQQVPDTVSGIAQPMEQASTDALQPLPDATKQAIDATIKQIDDMAGPAGDAAKAVGEAIVNSMRDTIESAADDLAKSAMDIVQKALDAAKKAAEEVKKSVHKGSGGDGGDETDSKASGGKLTPGIWTLVGENGPELISPNGFVYTATQTSDMLLNSINSGLFTLEKFAKGGQSATKSKSKSKGKSKGSGSNQDTGPDVPDWLSGGTFIQDPAEKKKVTTPKENAELDMEQKLLELTLQRDRVLGDMAATQEKLTIKQYEQQRAAKGSIEDQLKLSSLHQQSLAIDQQIYKITYEDQPLYSSMFSIQTKLTAVQKAQAEAAKGDYNTRYQLANLETQRLANEQTLAQLQLQSLPARQQQAAVEKQIADAQKGSLEDQLKTQQLTAQQNQNNLAANLVQQQMAGYDQQILAARKAMLPVSQAISKIQKYIDDVQKGSLQDQYTAIDLETKQASLRLEEIKAAGQLRDVNAGVLNLSQDEINALNRRLEIITNEKAQLSDQTEEQQLQGTIATADQRKQLVGLQAQEKAHQDIIDSVTDQKDLMQLQIDDLQAQNAVLDLQVQNISLSNTIRADALGSQLINLQAQVAYYDQMIDRVNNENALVQAQSALLNANNAVAANGYTQQINMLQTMLDRRQSEIDKLNTEKTLIDAQTGSINTQNQIAAAGYDAQIIALNGQLQTQNDITTVLNAQMGTLNAQKQIYQDIRNLADAIANRPVAPPMASPTGGPPGAVAATATKDNNPTLYLSRGSGTDGWYTSDGRLIVSGGSAAPPSGYKVKWLAAGGPWRQGEMAVVGENGPELAIAQQDLHVFPNERSTRIARAFGKAAVGGASADAEKHVTVNVEYHRHSGTDYGEGTLQQVVREAITTALRS